MKYFQKLFRVCVHRNCSHFLRSARFSPFFFGLRFLIIRSALGFFGPFLCACRGNVGACMCIGFVLC